MNKTRTTERWTARAVPDQSGRVAVVTGGNTGLGFETARVLARRGVRTVLACRDLARADEAARRIVGAAPTTQVETVRLDLSSLASVREAADELRERYNRIDLLINNAGVMFIQNRRTSADGFEQHLAVNHLGHFALTGLLADRIIATPGARVVTVSSLAHRSGRIDFDDLQSARNYRQMAAYGQSKLANLMFTYELQRRMAAAGHRTLATAAHPGGAATELAREAPSMIRLASRIMKATGLMVQPAAMGALPTLRAATDPRVPAGAFYGPDGCSGMTGHPTLVDSSPRSHDRTAQERLWRTSEELTGVNYPF
ncbi:oxidoreductase [Streptomyces sp. NPDC046805]|uniref:oxidoreductase n=1 Tax=Streptomyces sp. NPDC046805 TaxID=3155134 RepID=UPI00340492AC